MALPKLHIKGYLPVGYKLLLSYVILVLIPVVTIGVVTHTIYMNSMKEQTRNNIQATLGQIRDNIHYKTNDIVRISDLLYYDHNLSLQLRRYEEGWETYEKTTRVIQPKLDNIMNSTGIDFSASVYFKNETLPEIYRGLSEKDFFSIGGRNINMYHLSRITNEEWYRQYPTEEYGRTMLWDQVSHDIYYDRVSLLRRLVNNLEPLDLEEIGFMRISLKLSDLFASVDYEKVGQGSLLIVRDADHRVIYHSGDLEALQLMPEHLQNQFLTIQQEGAPWSLTAYVPTAILAKDVNNVRYFTIFVCLICMVIFTIAGHFVSRYFSLRVNKVVSVLNAFREGNFQKRMYYPGKDEFSQISVAINAVGSNTESLIREVYLSHIQKKEAELETLQSQINPHFLYNTLSSINRLAKFGDMEKLQQMVLGLAKFYRLTLNEGRTMIPVHTEIEQARAYLDIASIKFGDKMEVFLDVDPNIWGYKTVKLILQPFIENVLEHARFGERVHIRITARKVGDLMEFQVIDDGVGMTQERIYQIFHPLEHVNAGFGIRNVNERIRLHYGDAFGVEIYSRLGVGTSIRIRIPAQRL